MEQIKDNTAYFIVLTFAGIYLCLSGQLTISSDVTWLMHVARSWLNGGQYYIDYYETNPPLAFYIYLPAVYLAHSFSISDIFAFNLYYTSVVCTIMLMAIQRYPSNAYHKHILCIFLLCWCYFIPYGLIGQRDQFAALLIFPHFVHVIGSLDKQLAIGKIQFGLILCFAAVGYMIKPYFIIAWLILFFFVLSSKKDFIYSIRQCHACFFIVLGVIYLITITVCHQDYLELQLPAVLKSYYQLFRSTRLDILLYDPSNVVKAWLSAMLFYALSLAINNHKDSLCVVFCLLSTSFLVTYFMQATLALSNAVPSVMFSTVLILRVLQINLVGRMYRILAISLLLVINIYNFCIYYVREQAEQDQQEKIITVLETIPENASYIVVLCKPANYYPAISKTITSYQSSFSGSFQLCLAYDLMRLDGNTLPFRTLADKVRSEFVEHKPDYIVTQLAGDARVYHELFLGSIFQTAETQSLWASYVPYSQVAGYVILKRKQLVR